MKKEEMTTEEMSEWRKGYDMGMQAALRQNRDAIAIGLAILDVLDRRYEPQKEDY